MEVYDAVCRFANVVADSDVDPGDLVHEALVRVLSGGMIDEIDDLGAYLRRAVLNCAANHRRSRGRYRRAVGRLQSRRDDDTARLIAPSDLADLSRLEPVDRAVVFLFVVERCPHREVAQLVDLSEVAVRARLSRALKRLRVELDGEDVRGIAR